MFMGVRPIYGLQSDDIGVLAMTGNAIHKAIFDKKR